MCVVYHLAALHSGGYGGVHDDSPYQVSHVGRLATRKVYSYAQFAHLRQKLLGAVNHSCYHLAGDKVLVASDG